MWRLCEEQGFGFSSPNSSLMGYCVFKRIRFCSWEGSEEELWMKGEVAEFRARLLTKTRRVSFFTRSLTLVLAVWSCSESSTTFHISASYGLLGAIR